MPTGHVFDSHFVIAYLIKKETDSYLRFIASFDENTVTANMVHGFIAQQIGNCNDLVVQENNQAYSENIHGDLSPCALWRRL